MIVMLDGTGRLVGGGIYDTNTNWLRIGLIGAKLNDCLALLIIDCDGLV